MLTKKGAISAGFSIAFVKRYYGLFTKPSIPPALTFEELADRCSEKYEKEKNKPPSLPFLLSYYYEDIYESIPGAPSNPESFKPYREKWEKHSNGWFYLFWKIKRKKNVNKKRCTKSRV